MTENQMIGLMDSISPESWPVAAKRLEPVRPSGMPANWLEYCVKEGWFRQITIQDNGRDAICVWYYISPDGGLVVQAAVNVTDGDLADVFNRGLILLAKRENCKYIQCHTRRLGLVLKGKGYGFHVEAVVLRKIL